MELGASVGWTTGEQATRFMLASKYKINENITLRAKIANNSLLAFAATVNLKPGNTIFIILLIFLYINYSCSVFNMFVYQV